MTSINRTIFDFIFSFAHRSVFLDTIGVFFAVSLLSIGVIAVFVFAVRGIRSSRGRLLFLIEAALAALLSRGLGTETIRFFYHHPRPFAALGVTPLITESHWSFPSGDAALLFALATTVFFMNRRWGWWLFALAFLDGIARVFAGVQWPFDIIGGAAVGILSAIIIHGVVKPDAERILLDAGSSA